MQTLTLEVTIDYDEPADRITVDVQDCLQPRTITTYRGGQLFTDERELARTLTHVIGGGIAEDILRFRRKCNE